jgi:hypothetical protein
MSTMRYIPLAPPNHHMHHDRGDQKYGELGSPADFQRLFGPTTFYPERIVTAVDCIRTSKSGNFNAFIALP